jgi:hypothetical protein
MGLFDKILGALGLRKHSELDDEFDSEAGDESDGDSAAASASSSAAAAASNAGAPDNEDKHGDEDDPERDPELEAEDDAASFDFARDIARYFTAEFRIEQAWNNHERRELLFSEYQVRDSKHWYQVQATFERWLESDEGKAKYPDDQALMLARMTTTQTVTVDDIDKIIEEARQAKAASESEG